MIDLKKYISNYSTIIKIKILLIVNIFFLFSCTNPFAPKYIDYKGERLANNDIEQVFVDLSYAYQVKDTLLYGKLLSDDFTYVYRNYERDGIDETWGRDEDMMTTYRMFNGTQRLELYWNQIFNSFGDSLQKSVSRSYTLDVMFRADDNQTFQGRAVLVLKRFTVDEPWKIILWRDETDN